MAEGSSPRQLAAPDVGSRGRAALALAPLLGVAQLSPLYP